jgi:hypothetical protein
MMNQSNQFNMFGNVKYNQISIKIYRLFRDECFQAPDVYEPVDFVTDVRYFILYKVQFYIV